MKIVLEAKLMYSGMSKDFVIEEKKNGCWESVSHKAKRDFGYTMFNKTTAHRYFYEKFVGNIPKGLHVLHKCDNPACCNPKHLFLGTNQDNVTDKVNKGRQPVHIGVKNPKCKLTVEQVIKIFYDTRLQRIIADEYSISESTIRDIKKYRTWNEITLTLRGDV